MLIPWQGRLGWRNRYPDCFKKWTELILPSFTSSWYTAHNQSQMWLDQRENKWCKEGFPPDAPTLLLQAWLNRDNNRSLAVQKIVEVKKWSCVYPEIKSFQCVTEQESEYERHLLNLSLFRWIQTIVAGTTCHFSLHHLVRDDQMSCEKRSSTILDTRSKSVRCSDRLRWNVWKSV